MRLMVRAACLVRGLNELGLLVGVLFRLTDDGLRCRGVFAEGLISLTRVFFSPTVLVTKGKAPRAWYATRYDPDADLRKRGSS